MHWASFVSSVTHLDSNVCQSKIISMQMARCQTTLNQCSVIITILFVTIDIVILWSALVDKVISDIKIINLSCGIMVVIANIRGADITKMTYYISKNTIRVLPYCTFSVCQTLRNEWNSTLNGPMTVYSINVLLALDIKRPNYSYPVQYGQYKVRILVES